MVIQLSPCFLGGLKRIYLVKNYIPGFILDRFSEGKTNGFFEGVALFVDLSGFTPLTDALLQRGNEGADTLSKIINHIFEPLVHLVYRRGGFIPYFAGDAFNGLFPLTGGQKDNVDDFLRLCATIINTYNPEIPAEFGLGRTLVNIKIGIAKGIIEWGIVGKSHKSYYFRGQPVDDSGKGQTMARQGEVIVHKSMLENSGLRARLHAIDHSYFRFETKDLPLDNEDHVPGVIAVDTAALSELNQFLQAEIIAYSAHETGEFRQVVSVFIGFEGDFTRNGFEEFANLVIQQANLYAGYFKEIDFGDKGGVMVVLFGIPLSSENNIYRALEFANEIKSALRLLKDQHAINLRIGITVGKAFAGLIGGKERQQYAAAGNCVNLAARFMVNAAVDEILVDEEVQRDKNFLFQPKGFISYKGFSNKIKTYKLVGQRSERAAFRNKLIGRSTEINKLIHFASPLKQHKFAGLAYVFGEAGVGKSHLCFELKQQLSKSFNNDINWLVCQADQILKKSFNPFVYFLKRFFNQSSENSLEGNKKQFEKQFEHFYNRIVKAGIGEEVISEYIRTKTVLAGLIGIHYEASLWDKLDAPGRYRNTIASVSNLIFLMAKLTPMVLELEDGHWFDSDSVHLLEEIMKKAPEFPIFFLLTSRYDEEGQKKWLFPDAILKAFGIPTMVIDLNIFSKKSLIAFTEEKLGGEVESGLIDLLQRTTNGNPFYLDQVLEYFVESESLIVSGGKWHLKDKSLKFSNSINAILTARIDRLSHLVKETVKAAAVIGREFEVPVLEEVMHNQFSNIDNQILLKKQIHHAERVQIWQAINEYRYNFKHSLLREAIYEMQLHTRLKELHRLIASAMEKLYSDNLEERYVDLAFHYEHAEEHEKTILYLEKSADYTRRNFQNKSAIGFYQKLLKLLDVASSNRRATILLRLGAVQELIGEWKECAKNFRTALSLAKKGDDPVLLGNAHNSLGYFLMLKGDYDIAEEQLNAAASCFKDAGEQAGIIRVLGNLGNLFFRQGNYEDAKAYFEQSIELAMHNNKQELVSQTAANLGLTFMNLGFYTKGIESMRSHLSFCKEAGDKQGMAGIYTNLGIVFFEKGDYEEALKCYERGLNMARELGDKHLMAIAIGSMGSIFQRRGEYDKAEGMFRRDLKVCQELGDKQGVSIAYGLLGELYTLKGSFNLASRFLNSNLELSRELGYQKGIAKALVNLGNGAFYSGNNLQAIEYYNEAITVARKIDNKLILGFSLLEKINPLLQLKKRKEAQLIGVEVKEIAAKIRNQHMLFAAHIAIGRSKGANAEDAEKYLSQLLKENKSDEQIAELYYYLCTVAPKNQAYLLQALTWYSKLVRLFPSHKNLSRLQELNQLKDANG